MCGIKKQKRNDKNAKKKFVETKGITLVALIITIVVLLLLSVVAIQIATGNFKDHNKKL